MERLREFGLPGWQAREAGNGVHLPETAEALALVDAGIGAGIFGYDTSDTRDTAQFDTFDEARFQAALAEDALAHEQAVLADGRKSKLSLLRGEPDGSVRGLRNAVISIGHWFDLDHAPEEHVAVSGDAGYAESWRIGWAERLPEIMQLSVGGPLEEMGLEETGHVPRHGPADPIGTLRGMGAADKALPGPSSEARSWLSEMMADEQEPDAFVFAAAEAGMAGAGQAVGQPAGQTADQTADQAAEELLFVEGQYVALHGPLFDGDALWNAAEPEDTGSMLAQLERAAQQGAESPFGTFDGSFG